MTTNSNSILLEPDSSLLDQHLMFSNPEGSIEDLLLQAPREEGEKPWTIIKPLPGFCVKLRKANSEREKVFINICKTDKIPSPEDISEKELMKILNSEEPSLYRVPMSIGEEREDVDKSGNPCAVYDIVVNSTFYTKVETSQIFRRFLLAATLEALEDKYGLTLEKEEFVVLKGRKCKGGMTEHRIQVRSKPLVEVLPGGISSQISDKKHINKSGTVAKKKPLITEVESTYIDSKQNKETLYSTKEPQYVIQWLNPEENGRNVIFAKFFLTGMLFAKDIELDVGEDRILLQTKKKEYFLDVFLPHLINQEKTIAKFSGHTKVLMLTMPLAGKILHTNN